ncbi:Carbon starvation protein CstA [Mariniphaga anaerophila]|uniref:Carbon starvation protein CstA n=1 Tax=Mariniphaga anaerophila TaxID=1484053 RepID=A0A1M4VUX6_9BACT|nr:carbon starvation protein A [Mariniphaga anaerophila]SHE72786.1 Carbon starvation protein CstA [Mariniphaga anaerophila]
MYTLIISLFILVVGYLVYSKYIERVFGADASRATPAVTMTDGVDYIPMPWWKIFLIQFLNIAGLGPIFGAVAGAMWGPVAYLWIILGSVFAGAVHDYFSGMLSIKHNGLSITEITGIYLGSATKQIMRGFTVLLMVIVGAVFIMGPAKILAGLTPDFASMTFWVWIVFAYYVLSTLLPINKVIGRIYPVFGFALLFMAVGLIIALFVKGYPVPELTTDSLKNFHSSADEFPIFPMLFITIACGAISGFHATQSPLMARCIKNEKLGRRVFYGAMITEAVVAMIWATISMSFFGGIRELNDVMNEHQGNAAWVVNETANVLLGKFGAFLAILGVVAAPITSGDTAFRSARLIVADFLNLKQGPLKNRLFISIPLFAIGFFLTQINFDVIWRYFAWSNQTLATVVLWTITVFLVKYRKNFWITLLPALFMTSVISTYLFLAPEGFHLSKAISYTVGFGITLISLLLFIIYFRNEKRKDHY